MGESYHAPGGGGIITHNLQLLSLLQGSPPGGQQEVMDPPIQKIYVDSPVFELEDDSKYKYVSTNVDDFDEDQHKAFLQARSGEDVTAAGGYEDNKGFHGNEVEAELPGRKDTVRPGLVPSRPFGRREEEEEDLDELRREEAYQEGLRRRLSEQNRDAEQLQIPRLDLSDDEDNPRDSLDPSLGGAGGGKIHEISLRDSLDYVQQREDEARLRHLMGDDERAGFNLHLNDQLQDDSGPHQSAPPGVWSQQLQQQLMAENQSARHQSDINTGQTEPHGQLAQMFTMQQPGPMQHYYTDTQAPVYVPSQHPNSFIYQRPPVEYYPEVGAYGLRSHQQGPSIQALEPGYNQLQPVPPPHFSPQHQATYRTVPQLPQHQPTHPQPETYYTDSRVPSQNYDQPQYSPSRASYQQYERQNPLPPHQYMPSPVAPPGVQVIPQQEERNHDNAGPSSPVKYRARGSPAYTDVPLKEKPKIDFLERNKKDYTRVAPGAKQSYGQLFTEKKKIKENVPPPKTKEKTKPGSSPVKASRTQEVTREDMFLVKDGEHPNTTENFWSQRAKSLAEAKRERSSGVRKTKRPPLQKYPSESRVDDMKSVHSAPPQLQPIQPPPRQAFTEPIRSELVPSEVVAGVGQPITHTIYTDDGQRVSVDINLKLMSPGPTLLHQPQPYPGLPSGSIHQYYHPQGAPLMGPVQQPQLPLGTIQRNTPGLPYQPVYSQQDSGYNIQHGAVLPASDRTTPLSNRSKPPTGRIPTPLSSPFKVLPPISSAEGHRDGAGSDLRSRPTPPSGQESSPRHDNTSYLAEMRKKRDRKPVEYRQYTVEDYKKLHREIRLGGLGPDLDSETLKEKRDKREKQLEYAQLVKDKNRRGLEVAPKKPVLHGHQQEESSDELLNRRRIAMEYAKSVPKPKVKPPALPSDKPRRSSQSNTRSAQPSATSTGTPDVPDLIDLAKLRERHEHEKQQAAMIRQNMEGLAGQG